MESKRQIFKWWLMNIEIDNIEKSDEPVSLGVTIAQRHSFTLSFIALQIIDELELTNRIFVNVENWFHFSCFNRVITLAIIIAETILIWNLLSQMHAPWSMSVDIHKEHVTRVCRDFKTKWRRNHSDFVLYFALTYSTQLLAYTLLLLYLDKWLRSPEAQ